MTAPVPYTPAPYVPPRSYTVPCGCEVTNPGVRGAQVIRACLENSQNSGTSYRKHQDRAAAAALRMQQAEAAGFVPAKEHRGEWLALTGQDPAYRRASRHGWVEATRLWLDNYAHSYVVTAGRTGLPPTFRATLRGCDCEMPSCPHPAKVGASRPATGWGGEVSFGRRRGTGCECKAYMRLCCGASWRPGDVVAYAEYVLTTFKPAKLGPERGPMPRTTIKYDPKHIPELARAAADADPDSWAAAGYPGKDGPT